MSIDHSARYTQTDGDRAPLLLVNYPSESSEKERRKTLHREPRHSRTVIVELASGRCIGKERRKPPRSIESTIARVRGLITNVRDHRVNVANYLCVYTLGLAPRRRSANGSRRVVTQTERVPCAFRHSTGARLLFLSFSFSVSRGTTLFPV